MRRFEGYMKGINLGGWISQYAEYDKDHFDSFITKSDIDYIASLGFDHVRVPVDYKVIQDEDGNIIESGFSYLENCLGWCTDNNLNMVIDLHECYGYTFDPLQKTDKTAFFYNESQKQRFLDLWKEIAGRFGKYGSRIAFEPLNEVQDESVKNEWNELIRRFMETVRPIAPDTYVITGGVWNNHVSAVKWLDKPYDDKTVYNFHCYEPLVFTHQGAYWIDEMPHDFRTTYPKTLSDYRTESEYALNGQYSGAVELDISEPGPGFFKDLFLPAIEIAEANDAMLYCGEYGVIDIADNASKLRWLKDIHSVFEKYGIGHALWNYKEKDFGLVDQRFEEIREDFLEIV